MAYQFLGILIHDPMVVLNRAEDSDMIDTSIINKVNIQNLCVNDTLIANCDNNDSKDNIYWVILSFLDNFSFLFKFLFKTLFTNQHHH